MNESIKKVIKDFIKNQLKEIGGDDDIENLTDDTQLIENGFIDSMMILNLIAFLEENYGILLSSEELKPQNFATIERICKLIISKKE